MGSGDLVGEEGEEGIERGEAADPRACEGGGGVLGVWSR